jgi:putative NADH-flavin reductase
MRITVIGASAGVGLETVRRALELGHTVTSLSRTIESLPRDPALTAISGSALNSDDVTRAITGAQAVLITLGTGSSMKATTLYTDAAQVIIHAARAIESTAPIITVTGFGAGDSSAYQNVLTRTVMKVLLGKVYANKTGMEQLLAASGLSWEIVRPGRLTNAPRTGHYRAIADYSAAMKVTTITRADVADYLVTEAVDLKNLHRYPALTS